MTFKTEHMEQPNKIHFLPDRPFCFTLTRVIANQHFISPYSGILS